MISLDLASFYMTPTCPRPQNSTRSRQACYSQALSNHSSQITSQAGSDCQSSTLACEAYLGCSAKDPEMVTLPGGPLSCERDVAFWGHLSFFFFFPVKKLIFLIDWRRNQSVA